VGTWEGSLRGDGGFLLIFGDTLIAPATATATARPVHPRSGWSQRRRSSRAAKFKGAKAIMASKNDQKGPIAKAKSGQF
jgi:hypothetical protein